MNKKPDFKHVLIISPREVCSQGLADAFRKLLIDPKFTFMSQLTDKLPDQRYDWSGIDLMIVDISQRKREIYEWYAMNGRSEFMPPAVFLGHPAKIKDAGFFFRPGASDYLELSGLKVTQLRESLVAVAAFAEQNRQAALKSRREDEEDDSDNSFPLHFLDTNEMEAVASETANTQSYEEMRADFINTGIMDILDREKLRKIVENSSSD